MSRSILPGDRAGRRSSSGNWTLVSCSPDVEFAASLRDCGATVVTLPPEPGAGPPIDVSVPAGQPAYVYFTSGSTGRPKGVVDCHRNVLHNVMRYTRALNIKSDDRLSLLQSCGFSGAVSSMFAALLSGATSCPVDMRSETPARLARWLDEMAVTIYHSVPSLFRSIASAGNVFRHVRVVRLEGDRADRLISSSFDATSRRRLLSRSASVRPKPAWCVSTSSITTPTCPGASCRSATR